MNDVAYNFKDLESLQSLDRLMTPVLFSYFFKNALSPQSYRIDYAQKLEGLHMSQRR